MSLTLLQAYMQQAPLQCYNQTKLPDLQFVLYTQKLASHTVVCIDHTVYACAEVCLFTFATCLSVY